MRNIYKWGNMQFVVRATHAKFLVINFFAEKCSWVHLYLLHSGSEQHYNQSELAKNLMGWCFLH